MKEIPLKQWCAEDAIRDGCVTESAVWQRVKKGKYPMLKLRKVNKRVVWVQQDARRLS